MNVLSFVAAVPRVIRYAWKAYQWAKEMDARGVEFLSPLFFAEARKKTEQVVLAWTKGQDKGIRALFDTDNHLLCGAGVYLKSDVILEIYKADKDLARQVAEIRLRDKDVTRGLARFDQATVANWNGAAADRANP